MRCSKLVGRPISTFFSFMKPNSPFFLSSGALNFELSLKVFLLSFSFSLSEDSEVARIRCVLLLREVLAIDCLLSAILAAEHNGSQEKSREIFATELCDIIALTCGSTWPQPNKCVNNRDNSQFDISFPLFYLIEFNQLGKNKKLGFTFRSYRRNCLCGCGEKLLLFHVCGLMAIVVYKC